MLMDDKRLLIDFGSTFTKVVYVDLYRNEIIAQAHHLSTVDSNITEGLKECFKKISEVSGTDDLVSSEALACSSAAGGLRIACIGFVPDYSSEAANLAALGAGAKVIGCYSYEITRKEIDDIEKLRPDIILLTGGTDGGDKKVIIHNAKMLAGREWPETNIIVAGNKAAYDEIDAIFKEHRHNTFFTKNVMPEIGRLDVDSCNKKIREIFIHNIVEAKGIGRAKALIKNVLMPTPSAVLEAARLLAEGSGEVDGLGELLIIDVGGATTDVHSIAKGKSSRGAVIQGGLPEPYVKRTVEGDLGLKFNIDKLIGLTKERGYPSNIGRIAQRFCSTGFIPREREEIDCHTVLSRLAVEVAINRHVGRIEVKYGPAGELLVQYGKDFTQVGCVIGTGGPIVFSRNPREILLGALFQEDTPQILKPKDPKLYVDGNYILYAVGLLSQTEPEKALRFVKKHLKEVS
jgi:uncharacterized protein (TIGR01319 family)